MNDIIDPLKIFPTEIILNDDHQKLRLEYRGIPIYKFNEKDLLWEESACGSNLLIKGEGKVIQALSRCKYYQSVRAKVPIEKKGIFEWDIIVEKACDHAWFGVCASEKFNYEATIK